MALTEAERKELEALEARFGKSKVQTPGLSPDEQKELQALEQRFGKQKEQPGLISRALNKLDSLTGAPTRAAIGAAQDAENPFTAFYNQFNEDPSKAPTGKELVQKAGVTDKPVSEFLPFLYRDENKKEANPNPFDARLPKGSAADPSISSIAGVGMDVAADWTNLAGAGLLKGGKTLDKAAEAVRAPIKAREAALAADALKAKNAAEAAKVADTAAKVADAENIVKGVGLISDDGVKAAELQRTAEKLGITPTRGMLSQDPVVKGLESSLEQSPSLAGSLVRKQTQAVRDSVQNATGMFLEGRSAKTATQVGTEVADGMRKAILEKYAPISDAYKEVESSTKFIPVNDLSRNRISRNIMDVAKANALPGSEEFKALESAAQYVQGADSVDKLKQLRTILRKKIQGGDPSVGIAMQPAYQKVDSAIDRLIMREAAKLERLGAKGGTEVGKNLVQRLKGANSDYKGLMELVEDIGGKSGIAKGKINGVHDFLDRLDSVNPADLADKLFKSNDTRLLSSMEKNFPQQFDTIKRFKLKELHDASLVKGEIDPNKFLKEVKRYEPEVQEVLFGKKFGNKLSSSEALSALEKISQSFPAKMGPSGTPQGLMFEKMLNPAFQTQEMLRYNLYKNKSLVEPARETGLLSGAGEKVLIPGMTAKEKKLDAVAKAIESAKAKRGLMFTPSAARLLNEDNQNGR